ncbi:DUF5131 family protein [Pseudophaeobacter sp. 1A09344]|uniref:DUF5131 family protein n=1 Tax=Pseudophaeobacter sp. 1A09344 TaxID=3098144 RepID=UPI0034D6D107
MAEQSKIEWTDHTFNPWEGCQKVAIECDHCYAESRDQRFTGGIHWGPKAPRRRTSTQNWNKPRRWNAQAVAFHAAHGRRQRVFCASLADVFDNAVDTSWREDLWALIRECDQLDWLLLTKRPQNIAKMLPPDWGAGWPQVWLGTSAGTQKTADQNIPHLLNVPASVRFVSAEPMLGNMDLARIPKKKLGKHITIAQNALTGIDGLGEIGPKIDWVICGGESGTNARPMHPDWARDLREQCRSAGTSFFFKQWGNWSAEIDRDRDDPDWRADYSKASREGWTILYAEGGTGFHGDRVHLMKRAAKEATGRTLDGQQWNEVPRGPMEGDAPCPP